MRGIFTLLFLFFYAFTFAQLSQITAFPRNLSVTTGSPGTFPNPSNVTTIQSDDGTRLTSSGIGRNTNSQTLTLTNFDFSGIPAGATIQGLRVNIEAQSNLGFVRTQVVQLRLNGSTFGQNRSRDEFFNAGTDEQVTYGGQNDLFDNLTITRANLQNSTFGVAVQFRQNQVTNTADAISVDYITITVFYNQPPVAIIDVFDAPIPNQVVSGNVITNTDPSGADNDPDPGTTLRAVLVTDPATLPGTLDFDPSNGEFTFTPGAGFRNDDVVFTYYVTDDFGARSPNATVTLDYPIDLPVEFISFDAKKADNGVQLTWKVGTEVDVDRYEVERSSNGSSFTKIGTVTATHSSSYNFTDLNPLAGTAYYRVRNVDRDGQFKYTTVAKYSNGKSEMQFKAFPTSTKGQVTFQHPSVTGRATISVHTLEGRSVRSLSPAKGSISTPVDLSTLPAGTYLLKYQSESGLSETFRVIKH